MHLENVLKISLKTLSQWIALKDFGIPYRFSNKALLALLP